MRWVNESSCSCRTFTVCCAPSHTLPGSLLITVQKKDDVLMRSSPSEMIRVLRGLRRSRGLTGGPCGWQSQDSNPDLMLLTAAMVFPYPTHMRRLRFPTCSVSTARPERNHQKVRHCRSVPSAKRPYFIFITYSFSHLPVLCVPFPRLCYLCRFNFGSVPCLRRPTC